MRLHVRIIFHCSCVRCQRNAVLDSNELVKLSVVGILLTECRYCCRLAILSLLFFSGCGDGGPPRHTVIGQVLVDGRPAERVMVQLQHIDRSVEGDDRYPVALTTEDGRFVIGDDSGNPGVLAGDYKITFAWLSSSGLDAVDIFEGAYSDPKSTTFTLRVPQDEEATFNLKSKK